jgi:hypothetical protein
MGLINKAELESCPNQPHLGDKTQHRFRHGVNYLIANLTFIFFTFIRINYMKFKIFILIIALVSIYSNYEAQAQCEVCIAPKMCTVQQIFVFGCGNVYVTFCYQCFVTNNSMTVDIIDITGICPGMEDAVWDAAFNWIYNHKAELCGNKPCESGPPSHLTITTPICGTMEFDGNISGKYRIRINPSCDKRCIREADWCYCTCTPDCDYIGCTPHVKITNVVDYPGPGNNCSVVLTGPGTAYEFKPGIVWSIDCQHFATKCGP